MIILAIFLLSVSIIFGFLLSYMEARISKNEDPIIGKINDLLPQTQCAQCGYPGCIPYATAISQGETIDKCVPGGNETIKNIASLLNVNYENNKQIVEERESVAFIREDECIGCTKCIKACPVDAILGSAKMMHTVIKEECTGCKLCIAPCPVDCIDLLEIKSTDNDHIFLEQN